MDIRDGVIEGKKTKEEPPQIVFSTCRRGK